MRTRLETQTLPTRAITYSVLDRLLDNEPEHPADRTVGLLQQVEQLREFIRRDVEALLNTRRSQTIIADNFPDLKQSVFTYGVDNFFSSNLATEAAKIALARKFEHRIRQIEPCLKDVHITIFKDRDTEKRTLKMRIEGRFNIQEQSQIVYFDTKLDSSSQHFTVEVPDE